MRPTNILLLPALLLALSACDSDGDTDAGPDGSASADSGPRDSGPVARDAGMDGGSDPCAGDDPTTTVGCNGALIGSGVADNAFGGRCTPDDEDGPGSCVSAGAVCYAFGREPDFPETAVGVCVASCTPNGTTYVNTSTCPAGSRCYDLDGDAFCFADCNVDSDCSTTTCDGDNSCIGEDLGATDGGVPDGSVPDGSVPDGSVADGGPADGGPADGGPADGGPDGGGPDGGDGG